MKYKFISNGVWFDRGTKAIPIGGAWTSMDECTIEEAIKAQKVDIKASAVFSGIRNGKRDEEVCSFDEFKIIEEIE